MRDLAKGIDSKRAQEHRKIFMGKNRAGVRGDLPSRFWKMAPCDLMLAEIGYLFIQFKRIKMKFALKSIPPQTLLYCFVAFYFFLNIFQAGFTGLTSDEGYYWYLSTHLDWGYYDHPPLLALLINLGRRLFSGELGVRFFNVLIMSAGLIFLAEVIGEKEKQKYFLYFMII